MALLVIVVFTTLAALVESSTIAIAFVLVAIVLAMLPQPVLFATHGRDTAAYYLSGCYPELGGIIGSALAPIYIGYMAQAWSLVPGLLIGAGTAFLSAMSCQFLVVKPIPEQDRAVLDKLCFQTTGARHLLYLARCLRCCTYPRTFRRLGSIQMQPARQAAAQGIGRNRI